MPQTYILLVIVIVNCQNIHIVQTGQVHPPVISPEPKWPPYAVEDGREMALSCCEEWAVNTTLIWQKDGDDVHSSKQYPLTINND